MGFSLQQGDIVQARTDAVVNAWNRNFIPYWLLIPQGVAKALRRAAGKEPFREVGRHGLLPLGAAVATGAGTLEAEYIIHAAALHWYWTASEKSVRLAAANVFACAEEVGVASLAVPLLGAGTGGVQPEVSLEIIREAWEGSSEQLTTEVWIYDQAVFRQLCAPAI